MSGAAGLALYRAASALSEPAARLWLARRAARGKEDPERLPERFGHASSPRPEGPLLWAHGASVGEAQAALALIAAARRLRSDMTALLTTGTRSSADLLAAGPPPGVIHQYAPVDSLPCVRRFLRHWRPDVAARIDSELWPATIDATARSGSPLVLVNGRISERSFERWRRAPRMSAALLRRFRLVLAQDPESAERFAALGADPARLIVGGALKGSAPPPEADPEALAALRAAIGARPVWLAASTHPGEERLALDAAALADLPGSLTILAPRHPERGPGIAAEAADRGLVVARRALGESPAGAAVYVADTLGEMGLWYRLAPLAFIGGSVAPMGGHNPWEPAALGAAIAHGPDVSAFAEPYAALAAADAAWRTPDAPALAQALRAALDPAGGATAEGARKGAAARVALARDDGPARRAAEALAALLPDAAA